MAAQARQLDVIVADGVDKDRARLDMAIPEALLVAAGGMVAVFGGQVFWVRQAMDDFDSVSAQEGWQMFFWHPS